MPEDKYFMPDIMTIAAARIFNVPMSHVTDEMRARVKVINHAALYSWQVKFPMPDPRSLRKRQFKYLLKQFEDAVRSDVIDAYKGPVSSAAHSNYLLQRRTLMAYVRAVIDGGHDDR